MAYTPQIPKDGEETINWLKAYEPRNYELIARSTALASVLRTKGKPYIKAGTLAAATDRYNKRQTAIQNSTVLRVTQATNYWTQQLTKFFGINGIGAIPLMPVAIGLAIGAGGAALVYYWFKDTATEARKDWETLKTIYPELQTIYDSLPTEQKENFKDLTTDIANNEFNRGKSQTPLSWAKAVFFTLLGIYVLKQINK
jgi:hypothetical protein